jgi:hypothetical protein
MCSRHSVPLVVWRHITLYIVMSCNITVLCVRSHLVMSMIWKWLNTCTVWRLHITVMHLLSHSVWRVIWQYLNIYIVESFWITLAFIMIHSVLGVNGCYIKVLVVLMVLIHVKYTGIGAVNMQLIPKPVTLHSHYFVLICISVNCTYCKNIHFYDFIVYSTFFRFLSGSL